MISRRALGLAMPALGIASSARAQGAWPNRPIRMVVPWPPGQATDLIGRLIASFLSERLGQPVVPDNRPGATGMIGTDLVAKAPPDGYTLLSASGGPITFAPLVQRTPYDPERDLTPIITFGLSPYILVVRNDFPATNGAEFMARLRAEPGKYTFCSSGTGGSQHLVCAVFNAMADVNVLHVPFQGSGAAMASLLSRTVDFGMETPAGALALIQQGSIRAIGQSLPRMTTLLPGMPTVAEATGVTGYGIGGWNGLMGPANMPPAITARLIAEMEIGLATQQMRDRLAPIGIEVDPRRPEAFTALLREQRALLEPLIRQLGIRADG
ncbi:MAG: tripartite tricarboxylate transporter substrate binding protein [Rhodospirillales bacterium]|nr:tripartite tricarboxylate transporter substrate binding protein [Rhodospirillales bacterium]